MGTNQAEDLTRSYQITVMVSAIIDIGKANTVHLEIAVISNQRGLRVTGVEKHDRQRKALSGGTPSPASGKRISARTIWLCSEPLSPAAEDGTPSGDSGAAMFYSLLFQRSTQRTGRVKGMKKVAFHYSGCPTD